MKNFENQLTGIGLKEDQTKGGMTYADLALACINTPVETGMKMDVIRARIVLLDKFKGLETGGLVGLEDEELANLKACVEGMTWGLVHADLVSFSDYVNSL